MLHHKCMECTDVSKSDEGEDWVLHVLIDKKLIPPDSLYSSETTLLNNAHLLSLTCILSLLSLLSLLYLLSFLILRVRSQKDQDRYMYHTSSSSAKPLNWQGSCV